MTCDRVTGNLELKQSPALLKLRFISYIFLYSFPFWLFLCLLCDFETTWPTGSKAQIPMKKIKLTRAECLTPHKHSGQVCQSQIYSFITHIWEEKDIAGDLGCQIMTIFSHDSRICSTDYNLRKLQQICQKWFLLNPLSLSKLYFISPVITSLTVVPSISLLISGYWLMAPVFFLPPFLNIGVTSTVIQSLRTVLERTEFWKRTI